MRFSTGWSATKKDRGQADKEYSRKLAKEMMGHTNTQEGTVARERGLTAHSVTPAGAAETQGRAESGWPNVIS